MKRRFNQCGSITKLSGNRSRPYMVRGPLEEIYNADTHKVTRKRTVLGYYATGKEADAALSEYIKNPYDLDFNKLTFAEVYQMYYDAKYVYSKKKLSNASKSSTAAAFKNCTVLHNKTFSSLRKIQLQNVIDNCTLKHSSLELIQTLFKQMYRYAIENDIVTRNYAEFVTINIEDDDESGVPFSDDELRILWQHKDDPYVDSILIMIYSGFRIAAFKTMKTDLDEHYFQGGVKTKAGKNRIVPIHPAIYDMVIKYESEGYPMKKTNYRNTFYSTLESLGIQNSVKETKHTPHDCRHTFSWLCDKYGVDDTSKHMLMGHAQHGDVESSVYGHRTIEELRESINKLKLPL